MYVGEAKKIKHRAALCTHVVENGMQEMGFFLEIGKYILQWMIVAICKIESSNIWS